MEIESKQSLLNSWERRLEEVKEDRIKLIGKKLKEHEENLFSITKM